MERGLLSNKELKSSYRDVVWFYLFQDFSDSAPDREAQRIAIRFGISSWPQHFLVDPHDLSILGSTGRSLGSFRAAVKRARVRKGSLTPTLKQWEQWDALARKLETGRSPALAQRHLEHEDAVVRYRALEILAKKQPELIARGAEKLLAHEHDQTRYLVCKVLSEQGKSRYGKSCARALDRLITTPGKSRNPNVVRCRAAEALGSCGDAESIAALAPHATTGNAYNSLTGLCIDAVAKIAARDPKAKKPARMALIDAFPPPPEAGSDARRERATVALARRVHAALEKLTGRRVRFPKRYDAAARSALAKAF